jgi:hypothetical protein
MAEFWQWRGEKITGTGYVQLTDGAGRQGLNTLFGDNVTGSRINSLAVQFQYNLSTDDVFATTFDTGTAMQDDHMAVVSTGSGATASATIQTNKHVRYIPGHDGYANFTSIFSEPVAGSNQLIGPFDDDDGFFVGFIGTDFVVGKRRNSIDFTVTQNNFNRNKLNGEGEEGFITDFTKGNLWRINYGWLGFSSISFETMNPNGYWVTFHVMEFPNSLEETTIGNPVLPMRVQVFKTSGTADVTLKTGSWDAGIIGNENVGACCLRFKSFNSSISITATNTLTNLFTLRSVSAFQTLRNKVITKLHFLSAATEGTKIVSLKLIKNASSIATTATYTAIDAVNSVIEYYTANDTISGGNTLLTLQLGKTDSTTLENIEHLSLSIMPTETLTFAAISSNATEISVSTRWAEEF